MKRVRSVVIFHHFSVQSFFGISRRGRDKAWLTFRFALLLSNSTLRGLCVQQDKNEVELVAPLGDFGLGLLVVLIVGLAAWAGAFFAVRWLFGLGS